MLDNTCIVDKANLGVSKCAALPGLIKCMITTPDNFTFTDEDASDPTFWADALLAVPSLRIYLWPNFIEFADKSEAAVYESNPLAYLPVRDGRYQWSFNISKDLCTHKKMFTHREIGAGRVLIWDTDNQLTATKGADGLNRGMQMELLWTEKLIFNDGTKRTKSPIFVVLQDNTEIDANGIIFPASFLNTIPRLTDVIVSVLASPVPDATDVYVTVATECDGTPISGLIKADFVVQNADGTTHATTSITEDPNVPGKYHIVAVSMANGDTVTLVPPASLSIKAYDADIATIVF